LRVRQHLSAVPRFIRQIFVVHWIYILVVLGFFSALCLLFPNELAGESSLGRFLSGFIALFWFLRIVLQLTYYDREVRRKNRLLDTLYLVALSGLTFLLGLAAVGGSHVLPG
jgi:4-hydroxybenzoate polyprenyltransferase